MLSGPLNDEIEGSERAHLESENIQHWRVTLHPGDVSVALIAAGGLGYGSTAKWYQLTNDREYNTPYQATVRAVV
jgi:hypothetical protein